MATTLETREGHLKAVRDFQDFALSRKNEDGAIDADSRPEYEALRLNAMDAIKENQINMGADKIASQIDDEKAREAAVKATGVNPTKDFGAQLKALPYKGGNRELTLNIPGNADRQRKFEYSVGTANKGGNLVDTELLARLLNRLRAIDGMRLAGAEVITTADGRPMNIPTLTQYTAPGNAGPTAESSAYDLTEAEFGQTNLNVHKYTGKVPVTEELLQDAIFDISSLVGNHIADAIAQKTERAFTVGDGTGDPKGLFHAPGTGSNVTTAASATEIKFSDLANQYTSIRRYQGGPGMRAWIGSEQFVAAVIALEGTDEHPVFRFATDVNSPFPFTLFGSPVYYGSYIDGALTANKYVACYGNIFNAYIIRDAAQVTITASSLAESDEGVSTIRGRMRTGGQIKDANEVQFLRMGS